MSYGKVHDAFWDSERIDGLSDRAALLALFLLTGPHRNAIGCFRLGTGAISDLPRFGEWGIEGVSKALRELSDAGFIVRDDRTGWTFIVNALKHDPIKGAKAAIHALGLLQRVPANNNVYQELIERLGPQLEAESKALEGKDGWPIEAPPDTPSKGDAIPKRSPEPLPEPEPTTANAVSAPDDAHPPSDLKSRIFGPCLHWLAEQSGKTERSLRSQVGRWCRDYGDGPTLEAMMAAQRAGPVEPVAYVERLLKSGGPRGGEYSAARQAALEDEVDRMVMEAARKADAEQLRADHEATGPSQPGDGAAAGEDTQRPAKPEVRRGGGGLRRLSSAVPAMGVGGGGQVGAGESQVQDLAETGGTAGVVPTGPAGVSQTGSEAAKPSEAGGKTPPKPGGTGADRLSASGDGRVLGERQLGNVGGLQGGSVKEVGGPGFPPLPDSLKRA